MAEITPNESPKTGVAVLIKPPRLFLLSIVTGLVLHLLWPLAFPASLLSVWLGLSLISGSLGILVWADGTFKQWQTAVNPEQATTALVTTGPYRFSRNPMYLAFFLLQLGVALALGSWWQLILLLPAWIVLRWGIIAREELYLAALFGETYRAYRTAVRRWL